MRVAFRDHPAFQRAALAVVGAGAVAAVAVGLVDLPAGRWAVAAFTALAMATPIVRGVALSARRRALAALAALVTVGGGLAAAQTLAPGWLAGAPQLPDLLATPLVGVVAALGLVPLHLEIRFDPVGRALAAAGDA